jgi:hypothetical protein
MKKKLQGILFAVCLKGILWSQCLSGNYTIGFSGTNFTSFKAAVDTMAHKGICGPVVFTVMPGFYNETVSISNAPGNSAINTITFQGQSRDSTVSGVNQVYIYAPIVYLTWKGLSGNYFELYGSHCTVTHNQFSPITVCFGSNDAFISNKISGQFQFNTMGGGNQHGNLISNNIVTNTHQSGDGIEVDNQDSIRILGNTINSIPNAGIGAAGIGLLNCGRTAQISRNKVMGRLFAECCQLYQFNKTDSTAGPAQIENNSFAGDAPTTVVVDIRYSNRVNFYFNSCSYSSPGGTDTSSTILSISNSKGINLRNNSLSNLGKGYVYQANPIDLNLDDVILSSDFNDLYTTGSTVAMLAYHPCYTLTALRAYAGNERYSISTNPGYVSGTDLQYTNLLLTSAGIPVGGITQDINFNSRDSIHPDIGAFEKYHAKLDASLATLKLPSTICQGTEPVYVTIGNAGKTTLTAVTVNWTINGVSQPPYNWTGTMTQGSTSASLLLGTPNFPFLSVTSIKAWVSNPNGLADQNQLNDTAFSGSLVTSLHGAYTIGGTGGDFSTFGDAVNALVQYGICGNVVMNVRAGVYNEQVMVPAIFQTNVRDSVLFQSETRDSSSVTLEYFSPSSANWVLKFNGASRVWFRDMKIRALNDTYGQVVDIVKNSTHIGLTGNSIVGRFLGTPGFNSETIHIDGPGDDTLYFAHNHIHYGFMGLSYGEGGVGGQVQGFNVVLADNFFDDQVYRSVFVDYISNILITHNRFINDSTANINYSAVYGLSAGGNLAFTRNTIINYTNGMGGVILGVNASNGVGSVLIENNFFSLTHNSSIWMEAAVDLYNVSRLNVFNNSIYIRGTTPYNAAFSLRTCYSSNFRNNIIYNTSGGYAFDLDPTSLGRMYSNYNDIYLSGHLLARNNMSQTSWKDYANLPAWRLTHEDSSSFSTLPLFKSFSDLHIACNSFLHAQGTYLGIVTTDIDSLPRANPPDVGASEFGASTCGTDLGISVIDSIVTPCTNSAVKVQFANYGSTTLSGLDINWKINGLNQAVQHWTGSSTPGTYSAAITLGNPVFNPGSSYTITVWTSNPNIPSDTNPADDTLTYVLLMEPLNLNLGHDTTICNGNLLRVGVSPTFTSIIWSTGSIQDSILIGTKGKYWVRAGDAQGCVKSDTMTVNLYPVSPAPIISQNGNTLLSSSITNNQWYRNGVLIAGATSQLYTATVGGTYTVSCRDSNGCMSAAAIGVVLGIESLNLDPSEYRIQPNPNDGHFVLAATGAVRVEEIEFYTISGALVFSEKRNAMPDLHQEYDFSYLPAGMYIVEVRTLQGNIYRKLSIR